MKHPVNHKSSATTANGHAATPNNSPDTAAAAAAAANDSSADGPAPLKNSENVCNKTFRLHIFTI